MSGEELYAHWADCLYTETGAGEVGEVARLWENLTDSERLAWDRLARCVTEGKGVTIGWQL